MDEYEPITGELRKAFVVSSEIARLNGDVVMKYMTIAKSELDDLCDNIDSVHAQLERENESLRKKVKHQSAQLSEVQGALERRNNGELKRHWQKELDRLKAERDSMAAALDAAQGEHAYAPESHYMMLPKDADGVPIHVGDVMEWEESDEDYSLVCEVCAVGVDCFFAWHKVTGRYTQKDAKAYHHYNKPTVEDVLKDFIDAWAEWKDGAAMMNPVETFAAKLRLAGDAE